MRQKFQLGISILLAGLCLGLAAAHGDALTGERATGERPGDIYALTVTSNQILYSGGMAARSSAGEAIPAGDVSGSIVLGAALSTADNRAALYHPDRKIAIKAGVFAWDHTGFTAADIGSLAYALDDQTVTLATNVTYDIVAGVIVGVDGTICWVDTGNIPRQGAQSVTSLAVSGNGTVGGTFAVSGNSTFGGTITAVNYGSSGNAGWSGVVTNTPTTTNVFYYAGGTVTNVVRSNL